MTKHELNSVRSLKKKMTRLEKQIEILRLSAADLVPARDDMPRSQEVKSRVEKLALKIVEIDCLLAELRKEFVMAKVDLTEKIIVEVEDATLQKFVLLRYVQCLSYKEVAHRMRFSLRYIYYLQKKFFKQFTFTSA